MGLPTFFPCLTRSFPGCAPLFQRCFFKFQSINTPRISVFRKAFPTVPWAFVFREPVQVSLVGYRACAADAESQPQSSRHITRAPPRDSPHPFSPLT